MRRFTLAAFLALVFPAAPVGAQHDHGGMQGMAPEATRSPEAVAKEAQEDLSAKLTRIQDKIDALDAELERTELKPAKRKKLEARLKKLLDKKNKLIDSGQAGGDEMPRDPGQHHQ